MRANLSYANGRLSLRGVSLRELAQRYGTPLYVTDGNRVLEKYDAVEKALSKTGLSHLIAYSYKSNSNLSIVRLLAKKNGGATVVNAYGIKLALLAGVKHDKILLAGPSKDEEDLRCALENRIGSIIVESEEEMEAIDALASERGARANVCLRLNLGISAGGHAKIKTGGKAHKFGIDISTAKKLMQRSKAMGNVSITGLQAHIGSQILDTKPFENECLQLAKLSMEAEEKFRIHIQSIDLGGGLGIPYEKGQREISPDEYALNVAAVLKRTFKGRRIPRLVVEFGRFIVGDSTLLLTRVNYIKKIGNVKWALTDAGMSDFMRVALYDAYHEIMPLQKRKGASKYNIGGPICESSDVFALNRPLPTIERNDFLAILDVGAYGLSMASNYNIRSVPMAIMILDGKITVIRRKEELEDIIRMEI